MSKTVHRYIEMLRSIPLAPRKIGSSDLRQKLSTAGHEVTARTVERDLVGLRDEAGFPIETDGAKPAGWYWLENTRGLTAPAMTEADALSLDLLYRYLQPLLPGTKTPMFKRLVDEGRATLRTAGSKVPLAQWRKRVAVVAESFPLLPPVVDSGVETVANEAVLHRRVFEVDYVAIGSGKKHHYRVHPQALVMQGSIVYVVALLNDYDDLRHLALHRMSNPAATKDNSRELPGFELEPYLQRASAFRIPSGDTIRLALRTTEWLTRHLAERALSKDQVIKPERGGETSRVNATVPMSEQLVWWLRSHSAEVEVLEPASLRRRMRDEAQEVARRYA